MESTDQLASAGAQLSREPLSLQVARALRGLILSGELPAGEPLPSEKALGERLGVGRSTVREALRILQAQGLISGGERVSTQRPRVDPEGAVPSAATALEAAMALGRVPLDDLVELRVLLERQVVRAVAARRPDLSEAEAALEEMRAAGADVERFHLADVAFHAALTRAAGNRAFDLVMGVLREAQAAYLKDALEAAAEQPKVLAALVAEHEHILAAARGGDGEGAAAQLQRHIEDFYARSGP